MKVTIEIEGYPDTSYNLPDECSLFIMGFLGNLDIYLKKGIIKT